MRSLISIFVLLAMTLPVMAQGGNKIFPYKYSIDDLPNGLRLITVPTDYPNLVSLYIVVQTGSRNEVESGKSGFAHLFEHLMFRGTEKYSAEAYNEIFKNAGADTNAYTSDDRTVYHATFSKEDLDQIMMVEADRFQNLKVPEELFKTETRAVLGEYNKNATNPVNKLFEVLRDTAFQSHTYKHTTMGFLRDVENMPNQYDYSLEFFRRYYQARIHDDHRLGRREARRRARHDEEVLGFVDARRIQASDTERVRAGERADGARRLAVADSAVGRGRLQGAGLLGRAERHAFDGLDKQPRLFAKLRAVPAPRHQRAEGQRAVRVVRRPPRPVPVGRDGARQRPERHQLRPPGDHKDIRLL